MVFSLHASSGYSNSALRGVCRRGDCGRRCGDSERDRFLALSVDSVPASRCSLVVSSLPTLPLRYPLCCNDGWAMGIRGFLGIGFVAQGTVSVVAWYNGSVAEVPPISVLIATAPPSLSALDSPGIGVLRRTPCPDTQPPRRGQSTLFPNR